MSTALFRNKLTTFDRKAKTFELIQKPGMTTRVIFLYEPEDELLMEYIKCSTFDDLYRNKLFREALDKRLACLELKQNE